MFLEIGASLAESWAAAQQSDTDYRLVVVKPAADLEAFALLRVTHAGRFPCPARERSIAYVVGELVDAPPSLTESLGESWLVPLADSFGDFVFSRAEPEPAEPEQVELPSVPNLDPWASPFVPQSDKKSQDSIWLDDPWGDESIWIEEYSAALGDGPDPFA